MSENQVKPYPVISENNCKACLRCVVACKRECLVQADEINDGGYQFVKYVGDGCTGCGDCYYTCPEPLAIEIHIPKRNRSKEN